MLQQKQISRVLSQGLKPLPASTSTNSPLAISLLSNSGLPLTTVTSSNIPEELTSENTLKIYSLLAVNNFKEQNETDWTTLTFEPGIKAIIERVKYEETEADSSASAGVPVGASSTQSGTSASGSQQHYSDSYLYVVIFYDNEFPDSVAKLKIDNVNAALAEGFKGYHRD